MNNSEDITEQTNDAAKDTNDETLPGFSSPFLAADIDRTNSDYWLGRRKLADAMRELIEASTISDVEPDQAEALAEELQSLSAKLRENRQLRGVIAYGKAFGSFPVANHEMLCVGGASHPMAPGLKHWIDGDKVRGSVTFGWAYEGPPGHTHGGWVAAIFDHFMGMAHMRSGAPGMTGGLSVKYRQPTPLNKTIDLVATIAPVDERKTKVMAEMRCEGTITATAEALFIKPRGDVFKTGLM